MVTSAVPIGGRAQMIQRCRIGELLSGIVPLSNHDVEEILQEQSGTHRKFGEIALAWGLCQPEHVWNAWCRQLAQGFERVDLAQVGVDAQASAVLSPEVARQFVVLPVRIAGEVLIVATAVEDTEHLATELAKRVPAMKVMFVHVDGKQLREMIEVYYPVRAAG